MTRKDVGNWIDRGQSAYAELNRVLALYLMRDAVRDELALRVHLSAVRGMVESGGSAADVAGYLRHIEGEFDLSPEDGRVRALTSIALWHVVQAERVRGAQRTTDQIICDA